MRRAPDCRSRPSVGAAVTSRIAPTTCWAFPCLPASPRGPMNKEFKMPNNETDQTVEAIVAAGPGVSVTVRLGAMREVRKKGEDAATKLDIAMLRAWDRSTLALREAESNQGQLRELIKAVTAPPWFPAAFLRAVNTDQGQRAVVGYGGHERWVTLGPGLAMDQFQVGDEVFLTHELNAILGKSPEPRPRHGETAVFDRMDGDQLVLRHRDDQILAWPAQYMTAADLKTGDRVLWDRNTFLVYDVIAKADPRSEEHTSELQS